jgi:hypothetical protein
MKRIQNGDSSKARKSLTMWYKNNNQQGDQKEQQQQQQQVNQNCRFQFLCGITHENERF